MDCKLWYLSSKFAKSRNLKFGTSDNPAKSKTKCIIFSKKKIEGVKNIVLDGKNLPWVSSIKYLGSILEENNSMSKDI